MRFHRCTPPQYDGERFQGTLESVRVRLASARTHHGKALMAPPTRSEIRVGARVQIVEKQNQRSGALTEGVVARLFDQECEPPARHQGNARRWSRRPREGRAAGECLRSGSRTGTGARITTRTRARAATAPAAPLLALGRPARQHRVDRVQPPAGTRKPALMREGHLYAFGLGHRPQSR